MDRRARALNGEYRRALGKLVGSEGLQGFVIGRWGECSKDLHKLFWGMAEARALHLTRSTGRHTSDGDLAVILNSYRRILSCRFIQAQEGMRW